MEKYVFLNDTLIKDIDVLLDDIHKLIICPDCWPNTYVIEKYKELKKYKEIREGYVNDLRHFEQKFPNDLRKKELEKYENEKYKKIGEYENELIKIIDLNLNDECN